MQKEIEERKIEVKGLIEDDLPAILGDETQLKQAFFNIFKNALQAMPHGGSLAVACRREEEKIRISIVDSGDGIKLDNIGRIFKSYKSDRHSGSALGLFIVEKIVREHRGLMEISSAEGEGTILSIILPIGTQKAKLIATEAQEQ